LLKFRTHFTATCKGLRLSQEMPNQTSIVTSVASLLPVFKHFEKPLLAVTAVTIVVGVHYIIKGDP
jgi:hypothetical protein